MSTAPAEGNLLAKTRDRELYFIFKKALYQGAAYHIVKRTSAAESGHQVWTDLHEWFGSVEVSRTVIDHYRNKLNSLRLTQTSSEANDYINEYILCSSKLEAKNKGYTAETKLTKYDDYDVAVQNPRSDSRKNFHDAVLRIRTREQELLKSQRNATSKVRRASTGSNKSSSDSRPGGNSSTTDKPIPSIPDWILRSIKPDTACKDLIRWRGVFNSESRHRKADKRTVANNTDSGKNSSKSKPQSDDASVGSGNNRHSDKKRFQKTMKSRRTKTSTSGISSTPHVRIKDDDDDNTSELEDDSDANDKPKSKSNKKKGGARNKSS